MAFECDIDVEVVCLVGEDECDPPLIELTITWNTASGSVTIIHPLTLVPIVVPMVFEQEETVFLCGPFPDGDYVIDIDCQSDL